MNRPSPQEQSALLDAVQVDYLQRIHADAGGSGSIFHSRQPRRLLCVWLLISGVFFHRAQTYLLLGGNPDLFAITRAFLVTVLAFIELCMLLVLSKFVDVLEKRLEALECAIESYAGANACHSPM